MAIVTAPADAAVFPADLIRRLPIRLRAERLWYRAGPDPAFVVRVHRVDFDRRDVFVAESARNYDGPKRDRPYVNVFMDGA